MTEKSFHEGSESALLEEMKQRARAALVSNDGLSREQSIRRARAAVERVGHQEQRR